MTEKDYILLGTALKHVRPVNRGTDGDIGRAVQWESVVEKLADTLETDNRLFNREKWVTFVHS